MRRQYTFGGTSGALPAGTNVAFNPPPGYVWRVLDWGVKITSSTTTGTRGLFALMGNTAFSASYAVASLFFAFTFTTTSTSLTSVYSAFEENGSIGSNQAANVASLPAFPANTFLRFDPVTLSGDLWWFWIDIEEMPA